MSKEQAIKDFREMSEEEVTDTLDTVASIIDKIFIPEGYGFILMTYPFGTTDRAYYVSNSNREDVVKAMKEFIKKTETTYGIHIKDTKEE